MNQADKATAGDGRPGITTAPITWWAGAVGLVAVGGALAHLSWGAWPDVLIDFGRELYVPWRLCEGDRLYADIAYLHGPLSPYVNAMWLTIFGGGLRTIVVCNMVLLAAAGTVLYRLALDLSDHLTATLVCLSFLTMFAFSQLISVGNYNWVCPYSHELTHGVLFSLVAVACLSRYLRAFQRCWIVPAGVAIGLVSLTKIEIFAAALIAVAIGFTLGVVRHDLPRRKKILDAGVMMVAILTPLAVAFTLLTSRMPASVAFDGMIGAWVAALRSGVQDLTFYRAGAGLTDVSGSLETLIRWLLIYAGLIGLLVGASLAMQSAGRRRTPIALGAAITAVVALLMFRHTIEWRRMASPWPVLLLVVLALTIGRILRRSTSPEDRRRAVVASTLGVFSLVLLAKLGLKVRIHHYGFALAMPGTALLIIALIGWLPRWIERSGGCSAILRSVSIAALVVVMFVHAERSVSLFAAKTYPVRAAGDVIMGDIRGNAVATMLAAIDEQVPPNATLAVLPDGVMINFLTRRRVPSRFTSYMPPEMLIYGEDAMLDAWQADPPDFVVLVHMDTSEYGVRFFGQDYGRELFAWIRERYTPVSLVGDPPLRSDQFGILLLKAPSTDH